MVKPSPLPQFVHLACQSSDCWRNAVKEEALKGSSLTEGVEPAAKIQLAEGLLRSKALRQVAGLTERERRGGGY